MPSPKSPRQPSAAPRVTTLLLDLDGTLLDIEMRMFLEAYFPLAARRFGALADTPRITQLLAEAARALFDARDGERTVGSVFLETLAPGVGCTPAEVRDTFAAFYRDEFEGLGRLAHPIPGARAFVERALRLGYELVLATNPVFFLDPIRARVRWAGLADVPFALITSAENMCWTKPHLGYYRQVLALTGRRPEQCLMVGDDPRQDMAAKGAGLATWLAVREGDAPREAPLADRRGTLAQLAALL